MNELATMKTKTGFKQTEVGLIPEDWEVETIKDIASITTGGSDTQDKVQDGKYRFFVRSSTIERINKYTFDGEAILTSGDGVGVGKIFHYVNGKFDFHQRVYNIYNYRHNVNGKYLFFQFSNNFFDRVMSMTAKSSVDSVRREMIAEMPIPLPPLHEQKAIATALSDVDALIQSLDALIAKKKAIKQGAMQELLTPPHSTSSGQAHKGGKRLDGFSGEWVEKKLGEICTFKQGLQCSIEMQFENKGFDKVRFIRIIDLTNSKEPPRYISKPDLGHIISNDDLFMVRYGTPGLIGYGYSGVIANNLFRLILRGELNSKFLYHLLKYRKNDILNLSSSTTMAAISFGPLSHMKLMIPEALEEQKAIAQILSDMDLEIASLERKKGKYEEIKQGMMQELLTGKTRLV